MTTAKPLSSPALTPEERALAADAAALDQIRREVAEAGAKGIPPSRAKLAEFARLQRSYIDRKMSASRPQTDPASKPAPEAPHFSKLTSAIPKTGKAAAPSSPQKAVASGKATPESGKSANFDAGKIEILRADGTVADTSLFKDTGRHRPSLLRLLFWLTLLGVCGYAAWMNWHGKPLW